MADEKKGFSPEEVEQLKEALVEVENKMGTKAADQIKKHLETAEAKLAEKYDAEMSDLKKFKIEATEKMAKNQEWIDEEIKKGKTIQVVGAGNNMAIAMAKAFEEKANDLRDYVKNGRKAIQFELKTVGNISAGNTTISGTIPFAEGPALWGPGRKPYEARHIREFCRVVPQGPGTASSVTRMTTQEGGPTSVAPGVAKPQSDIDWVKTVIPITKIAHYYKVDEESLADNTWLQDEITGVGVEELMVKEDSMFLTNNAGGEFLGLNQTFNSTAYSTPASLSGVFTGAVEANNYDVLVAAWTQLRILKSITTAVLLHPADYAAMILTKDTTGQYPFGAPNQNIPNLFGAPIIAHTAVTSDKFFLGDFSKVKIGVRAGLTVRFYDQNEDDAIKNMVTIVIEERVTMAADRADRIIYGDFSDAQTALES